MRAFVKLAKVFNAWVIPRLIHIQGLWATRENSRAPHGRHNPVGTIARLLVDRLILECGDENHPRRGEGGVQRHGQCSDRRDPHLRLCSLRDPFPLFSPILVTNDSGGGPSTRSGNVRFGRSKTGRRVRGREYRERKLLLSSPAVEGIAKGGKIKPNGSPEAE